MYVLEFSGCCHKFLESSLTVNWTLSKIFKGCIKKIQRFELAISNCASAWHFRVSKLQKGTLKAIILIMHYYRHSK